MAIEKDNTTDSSAQEEQSIQKPPPDPTSLWLKRLIISATLLVWLILLAVLFWVIGRVSNAVILLAIGATIATIIHPLAKWLERVLPRLVAIGAIYLVIFALVSTLLYFLANVIIEQVRSLIPYIQSLINSNGNQLKPILDTLRQFGIDQSQLQSLEQQLIGQLQGFVNSAIPLVGNLFSALLNIILVALLSIYLLLSGPRVAHWLRHNTPLHVRGSVTFLLDTLEQSIGNNFRGVFLLAVIIGTVTGAGLFLIGVPYSFLLGTIAFALEFIPFIGFYITAITIVLFALTQGWTIALIALGFVIVLQVIEGEILVPRIVGGAIGINPIVAIVAIVAGTQLFGILGAFFSGPVAGVIQAILVALWSRWKESHPDQVPQEERRDQHQGDSSG